MACFNVKIKFKAQEWQLLNTGLNGNTLYVFSIIYITFFASWRLVDAYARLRFDLAFLLLLSFVPHGMYGTPQIKLPTKSSLLQTRARNLNKKKLLRANGRCKAAKKEFTRVPAGSYKFISLVQARQIGSANDEIFFPQAQITAIRRGINCAACFKIFQVKLNLILASFKCQTCLLSSDYIAVI